MRRIQAFEFNERQETPRFLRDSVTEILGLVWRWMRPFNPVGAVFADFCRRAGCETVLDLASGSGEPVSLLVDGLRRQGVSSVRFLLSDLFPKPQAMKRMEARYPDRIGVLEEPVDATDVPADIQCDACTIVGAFHHFPPEIARKILADCVRKRRAVFVMDLPRRSFVPFVLMFPLPGALGMVLNPFISGRDRLLKALFTFVVPVIPACGGWDMWVTAFRAYSPDDYLAMTEDLRADFHWEYRDVEFLPGMHLAVFYGLPVKPGKRPRSKPAPGRGRRRPV